MFPLGWKPSVALAGGQRLPRVECTSAGPELGPSQSSARLVLTLPELPASLGFSLLIWKYGCWPDYLFWSFQSCDLVTVSVQFPGVMWKHCSLYLLTLSLGITPHEKKTRSNGHNLLSFGSWVRTLCGQRPCGVIFFLQHLALLTKHPVDVDWKNERMELNRWESTQVVYHLERNLKDVYLPGSIRIFILDLSLLH